MFNMFKMLVPLLLVGLLSACGGRQSVLVTDAQSAGDADSRRIADTEMTRGDALWQARGDRSKAEEAISAWEAAAKADPTHVEVQRNLTYGYYFVNNVHVRWDEDGDALERENYEKGVAAAERALALANPAFAKEIAAGNDTDAAWNKALAAATKEDVKALYWYATNLAKWALKDGIASLLKYKDRAYAIMQRCKTLDSGFWYGGPARYLGAYWLKIPFGKSAKKSKANFDLALQAGPGYLDTQVLLAEIYAVRTDDEDLFKQTLEAVINTPAGAVPALDAENKNAQRIAKEMLDNIDDYF